MENGFIFRYYSQVKLDLLRIMTAFFKAFNTGYLGLRLSLGIER